jgi:predicted short-subunit dehydrogenase-like oxidoreductase (DUF2520 family)
MTLQKRYSISIIGAGRVGTVLGRELSGKGQRIVSVISASPSSAKRCAELAGCAIASTHLSDISLESDIVLVTTPDDVLCNVAEELAAIDNLHWDALTAAHTSGALTTTALLPLKRRGAKTVSIHPMQTFSNVVSSPASLKGIYFGVEGDPDAIEVAKSLIHDVEGHVIIIQQESKTLYHVAGVLASNYLVTLINLIGEIFSSIGVPRTEFFEVIEPLLDQTLRNIKHTSPANALTGPIERGDVGTVRLHLEALSMRLPHLIPFYTAMGLETVRMAVRKGSISEKQAAQLLDFMSEFISAEQHAVKVE